MSLTNLVTASSLQLRSLTLWNIRSQGRSSLISRCCRRLWSESRPRRLISTLVPWKAIRRGLSRENYKQIEIARRSRSAGHSPAVLQNGSSTWQMRKYLISHLLIAVFDTHQMTGLPLVDRVATASKDLEPSSFTLSLLALWFRKSPLAARTFIASRCCK